jgi:hypothetical protein
VLRAILCVGLVGSAATVFLGQNAAVTGIAVGVFFGCLVLAVFRVLRGASRRIDRILAEELTGDDVEPPVSISDQWRKSA